LWKHVHRPVTISLVVDNFGIKYIGEEHFHHLVDAIKEEYKVEIDETGGHYCGIKLDWDYDKGYVNISMPGYVHKQLTICSHVLKRKTFSPYDPCPIHYGKTS
jgi:hypothetical protein